GSALHGRPHYGHEKWQAGRGGHSSPDFQFTPTALHSPTAGRHSRQILAWRCISGFRELSVAFQGASSELVFPLPQNAKHRSQIARLTGLLPGSLRDDFRIAATQKWICLYLYADTAGNGRLTLLPFGSIRFNAPAKRRIFRH